jgi:pectate lyase
MQKLICCLHKINFNPVLLAFLLFVFTPNFLSAQQLAFPTAEGFGAYSLGGRGGDVYTVSNINDSGEGSLREGIQSATGPRTIVFAVSGLIKLKSTLKVDKDYITIAGQTAPGDGICLRDACFQISADHVIVRYIRSRLGDEAGREADAISITSGYNIIMDHCSASWSVDECFSCSTGDKDKIDSVTVQWSIISEALNNSIHEKGSHSYGALIRGCYGAKYSYHHNLFAHNRSRNPRPGNYDENTYLLDSDGLLF